MHSESITQAKQRKIVKVTQQFLQHHGNQACRFDAIVMDKEEIQHIQWIKHAFEV